jgi:hypothetical protein
LISADGLIPPAAAIVIVLRGNAVAVEKLDPILLESGNTIVTAVRRALSLLVRMVSQVYDSESRMRLTRLVGEMRAPDRSAVAPNLLLQQVVFTMDLPHGRWVPSVQLPSCTPEATTCDQ